MYLLVLDDKYLCMCIPYKKNNQPLTSQCLYEFQGNLLNCAWKHGVAISNEYPV